MISSPEHKVVSYAIDRNIHGELLGYGVGTPPRPLRVACGGVIYRHSPDARLLLANFVMDEDQAGGQ